jgi:hypothetical protein
MSGGADFVDHSQDFGPLVKPQLDLQQETKQVERFDDLLIANKTVLGEVVNEFAQVALGLSRAVQANERLGLLQPRSQSIFTMAGRDLLVTGDRLGKLALPRVLIGESDKYVGVRRRPPLLPLPAPRRQVEFVGRHPGGKIVGAGAVLS